MLIRVLAPVLLVTACHRETSPPTAPPAPAPAVPTPGPRGGAAAGPTQTLAPPRSFDYYLDAFHVMRNDPSMHIEVHHFCRDLNDDISQCALFDGNAADAKLTGIEYIISERMFGRLPAAEQARWHPHNYEILSGQLVLPGLPDDVEKAALAKKLNSYGKTWHTWDTGHMGTPGTELPVGEPMLAWSYNHDGEIPQQLLERRDRQMGVDTQAKRRYRQDLAPRARRQQGEDALRQQLGRR